MQISPRQLLDWLSSLRNRHFFGVDVLLLTFTPLLAFLLRTDGLSTLPDGWYGNLGGYVSGLAVYTGIALLVRLVIFHRFGLYRRYWRYASIEELDQIAWAVLVSTAAMVAIVYLARTPIGIRTGFPLWNFPRSVALIDGLLVLVLVGGVRFSVRLVSRRLHEPSAGNVRRVLVMGAGDAGAMIVREMKTNRRLGLEPVGFIDDDMAKHDVHIHGVPVLGSREDIPELVRQYAVRRVIIAMPTAPGKVVREVVRTCEQAGVQTLIIPGMPELLDGTVSVSQLREVDISDLLRREAVETDVAAVETLIRGKRVLVTGGGGSIGSELCRQILRCQPEALVLLGHGENSIFDIHNELRQAAGSRQQVAVGSWQAEDEDNIRGPDPTLQSHLPNTHSPTIIPLIADIRFADRVQAIFDEYRPEIVFHAAAHKHVPLMEMNPAEAITNNVLGTRNVVQACLAAAVERFVMISTDKAVNPTSVMGASKRVAELLVHQAAAKSGRAYVAVRFGNVLGSRGSVIHTFKRQIAEGGPVTVTHPEMNRFFMTIPEAVQLVLQASVMGTGGQVFVLDMGEPVKILDLARDLIELSGLSVGRDIDIVFSGLRPGEKLYEELFTVGERYDRTPHAKIFWARNASTLLPADIDRRVEALLACARASADTKEIIARLQALVSEYRPPDIYGHDTEKKSAWADAVVVEE